MSTMKGALLGHPTRWVIGSGFKNGTVGGCFSQACLSGLPSYWSVLVWGQGGNVGDLLLAGVAVALAGGWAMHSLRFPLGWFKANAGVRHFLAMWPPPLTSKTLERVRFLASDYTSPLHRAHGCSDHCPGSLFPLPPILWVGCRLGWSAQGLPLPLQEFGQLGVLLPLQPLSAAMLLGTTWGTWRVHYPVQSGIKIAINLAICWLSSCPPPC